MTVTLAIECHTEVFTDENRFCLLASHFICDVYLCSNIFQSIDTNDTAPNQEIVVQDSININSRSSLVFVAETLKQPNACPECKAHSVVMLATGRRYVVSAE